VTTLSAVLAAALADRCQPFLPLRLPGGQALDRGPGIIELCPEVVHGAPTIISAGIHGNETAPLELLAALAGAIDAGTQALGAPVLLIVGHPSAIVAGERYLQTNLNRLFKRDSAAADVTTDEHTRAARLMTAVDAFWAAHAGTTHHEPALHLDMHTAIRASQYPQFVVEPYSHVTTPDATWQALSGAGMQAVLSQHRHSWTFSHYSRHYHEVVAFTLELGQVAGFGHNDLSRLTGMQRWLSQRVAGGVSPCAEPAAMDFFQVVDELMREGDDFALAFANDTPNFTRFEVGQTIATDSVAGPVVVRDAPLHVVFPNAQVERGARAALLVRPLATA